MTDAELRKAEARYRRAAAHADKARVERNDLVRAALRDGWTHDRIAKAIYLSRARVNQIAQAAASS